MTSYDYIAQAQAGAHGIEERLAAGDLAGAMASLARANHALCDLAPLLVEKGVHAGYSQRRMARLLDIPESALRGARKEFAA